MNRSGLGLAFIALVLCGLAVLGLLASGEAAPERSPPLEAEPSAGPTGPGDGDRADGDRANGGTVQAAPVDTDRGSATEAIDLISEITDPPPCWVGLLVSRGTVDVVAESGGTLEALRVSVGDRVSEGQELAVVRSPDAEHLRREQEARVAVARTALDSARVEAGRSRREMERRQGTPELFSTEQIEAAETELELAELARDRQEAVLAEAETALERLEAEARRRHLRAPFDGRVSARHAVPGANLLAGQPLLRLVSTAEPIVRFAVPAHTVSSLPPGTEVKVELAARGAETVPLPPVSATIETLAPVLDEASQMVFVEASAPAEAWTGFPVGAVTRVSTTEASQAHGSCDGRPAVVLPE